VKSDNIPIDVNAFVKDIIQNLAPPEAFQVFIDNNLPVIQGEKLAIDQVFSNFISNAIKYSPLEKKIHIHCDLQENNALVSVKDEGMGIATADLEKLFERYYRVKNNQTRQISGFGIGLYLSYEIIERHHGKIWAESEIGKGATFYFSIPLNG
jgi:signal transduction histidine kinase